MGNSNTVTVDDVRMTVKKIEGEWAVAYYVNGVLDEGKTYYSGGDCRHSKEDAIGTMRMQEEAIKAAAADEDDELFASGLGIACYDDLGDEGSNCGDEEEVELCEDPEAVEQFIAEDVAAMKLERESDDAILAAKAFGLKRTTINKINSALPDGFEIVRGKGYFYFAGDGAVEIDDDPAGWPSDSIHVYHLNEFTVVKWVEFFNDLRSDFYARS